MPARAPLERRDRTNSCRASQALTDSMDPEKVVIFYLGTDTVGTPEAAGICAS